MKRRSIDPSKLRRPLKRSRITESIYGRFFLVWIMVLTADFLLEFRFEYLWPFWLLLRSAYDSFKYQGLAFSLLFLTLAFCSDLICLMFLPVHWLFFAASTYVWVQFVWHTDRGLCVPTVSLWLLFVYVEASVRLRELKNLPFHLDLCRPFAAHCIGYPVVTLGYGVKSYVGYKMRQRRVQHVAKENEFYMQLINLALPPETNNHAEATERSSRAICNGKVANGEVASPRGRPVPVMTNGINTKTDLELLIAKEASRRGLKLSDLESRPTLKGNALLKELDVLSNFTSKKTSEDHNLNELDKLSLEGSHKSGKVGQQPRAALNGVIGKSSKKNGAKGNEKLKEYDENDEEDNDESDSDSLSASSSSINNSRKNSRSNSPKGHEKSQSVDLGPSLFSQLKEERLLRRRAESNLSQLENDSKRLRVELQTSRQGEQELRSTMHSLMASERSTKVELQQLKAECEVIQQKLQNMSSARQQDRNTVSSLERKLKTERDSRLLAESQLREERKRQKAEDAAAKQRDETTGHDACNALRIELEEDSRQLRALLQEKEEEIKRVDKEAETLRQKTREYDSMQLKKETEVLMSALTAMQGKNTHLENSLSSETRLKLDLFSALGDTRRQLEIAQTNLKTKDREIESLKLKIAEVMAVMPTATTYTAGDSPGVPRFASNHLISPNHIELSNSGLDPSAPCYIPVCKSPKGLL
ncbi:macoilin-like isoform X2 [Pocillopora damicornis]|uniref:macoilin-like isoform X2 n=1 Tax=Pocillopora damicornis TaxID=46731 RepID=UPI000F5542C5|nr:macoilin-like isoform X2 [Pocillopora damicornis]